jgi:hypothetical protein
MQKSFKNSCNEMLTNIHHLGKKLQFLLHKNENKILF